jgi:hypothetical protein
MRTASIQVLLLASGLALAGPAEVRAQPSACVPAGVWIDPASNERRDDAITTLAKRKVVLLGEAHDEAEHHRWQLHTIAALRNQRPDMVLGF